MRILLVNAHGADKSVGGAERYVFDLAAGLALRGHETLVLSAFPVKTEPPGSETLVLHTKDWREDYFRRAQNHVGDVLARPGRQLTRVLKKVRPDLVHTNNLPGISTAVWEVSRRLRIPVVHTLHDYQLLCPRVSLERGDGRACRPHPLLCGFRTRRLSRWAPAVSEVIAGSEYLWRLHARLFPTRSPHIIRLPIAPISDRPLIRPGAPPRVIGYLGALERSKGIESLLDAVPRLADLGCTTQIAGGGRLRSLVEEATGQSLRYAGPLSGSAKLAFIEATDLGIVPSRWAEPSGPPYVVCEWLAAGRPVLASVRGGLGEAQVLPGVLPIEPSESSIVDAVRRLRDRATWEKVVERVPQVENENDFVRWLDAHEAVYRMAFGDRTTDTPTVIPDTGA